MNAVKPPDYDLIGQQYEDWVQAKEEQRQAALRRSGKGCWYQVTVFECPLCGRSTTYRERRHGPKPEQTWEFIPDACGDHFL